MKTIPESYNLGEEDIKKAIRYYLFHEAVALGVASFESEDNMSVRLITNGDDGRGRFVSAVATRKT